MAEFTNIKTEGQLMHEPTNELNEDYERIQTIELRNDLLLIRERIVELGTHAIDKMTKYEREHLWQLYQQRNDEKLDDIPETRTINSTLKSDIQFVKKIVKFMEEFYPKMLTITRTSLVVADGLKEYDILKQEINQLTKRVEHMHQIISTPSTLPVEGIEPPASEVAPPDNNEDNDPYEHLDYMHSKYLENVKEMNDLDDGPGPYHTNDPRDDCDDLYGDYGYGSNYDGGYDSY